jgi:hypothetical protein
MSKPRRMGKAAQSKTAHEASREGRCMWGMHDWGTDEAAPFATHRALIGEPAFEVLCCEKCAVSYAAQPREEVVSLVQQAFAAMRGHGVDQP